MAQGFNHQQTYPRSVVLTLNRSARVHCKDAENYVELIGDLISMIGEARLTNLAEHIGVNQGPAAKVVLRLKGEGLVESLPYRSIFLTAHGLEVAANSRVRHEIVRMWCRGGYPAAKIVMQAKDARPNGVLTKRHLIHSRWPPTCSVASLQLH